MNGPLGRRLPAAIVILVGLVVGSGYVAAVPPWEAPDEPWHLAYAESLAAGRLPRTGDTYEAHQPPGYYALVAVVLRVTGVGSLPRAPDNPWYPFAAAAVWHLPDDPAAAPLALIRTLSGFLGATAVALTWATARLVWREDRSAPLLAGLAVALVPQQAYLSHMITNDTSATAVGALTTFGLVAWVVPRGALRRSAFVLGAAGFLGTMAKLNAAVLVVAVVPGAILVAWRDRAAGRSGVARRAIAPALSGVLGVLAGVLLLSTLAPSSMNAIAQQAEMRAARVDPALATWSAVSHLARGALVSTWGRFGWLTVDLPEGLGYVAAAGACVGLAGSGLALWRGDGRLRRSIVTLGVVVGVAVAAAARSGLVDAQPQGRLAFTALPAAACLMAVGWATVAPRRWRPASVASIGVFLVVANVVATRAVIPGAYAPYTGAEPLVDTRVIPGRWEVVADVTPAEPSIVQTFRPTTARATRVAVPVAAAVGRGHVSIRVRDGEATIAQRGVPLEAVSANAWLALDLPGGALSPDREYALEISVRPAAVRPAAVRPAADRPAADAGDVAVSLGLWGGRPGDVYPLGRLRSHHAREDDAREDGASATVERDADLMLLLTAPRETAAP